MSSIPSHDFPSQPVNGEAIVPVAPTPNDLLRLAVMQDLDIDKLQKLIELKRDCEREEARKAFVVAMNQFKANPPTILKNKHIQAGQANYDYASLDAVCRAVITGLSEHGISHRWKPDQGEGWIKVTCILTHDLGHSEETTLQGAPDQTGSKNAVQAIGSTVAYLERYTLLAACGLAASNMDNDGRGATSNTVPVERFRECCGRIERAKDLTELWAIYSAAYREASEARDRNAMAGYIQLKDARKAELK